MVVLGLAFSLLIGVSLGLLGGGGSILTVPTIHYAFGVETHAAIVASLFVVGTTSLAALVPHARAGRVRWATGLLFGSSSMVGAFAAGRIAKYIPATLLLVAFGIMMLVTAAAMLRRRAGTGTVTPARAPVGLVIAEGLVVGGVTGLVGAGGGFLVVPALVLLGGLGMAEAVGTSLLVIAMKSFAAFAGAAGDVSIDVGLIAMVSVAAIVGSFGGAYLAGKVPSQRLQRVFGWFIVVMAVFILGQELPRALGYAVDLGSDWPWVFALVAATLGMAFVVEARQTRTRRLAAAIAVGALVIGTGCKMEPSPAISAVEARRAIAEEGAILLDVRSRQEFSAGHLPNARNIPLAEIAERRGELPGDRMVIVYCRTGRRSAEAATQLSGLRVRDLGPIDAW